MKLLKWKLYWKLNYSKSLVILWIICKNHTFWFNLHFTFLTMFNNRSSSSDREFMLLYTICIFIICKIYKVKEIACRYSHFALSPLNSSKWCLFGSLGGIEGYVDQSSQFNSRIFTKGIGTIYPSLCKESLSLSGLSD